MTKTYLASLAALLIAAGASFGQGQEAPTLPAPRKVPDPPPAAAPVTVAGPQAPWVIAEGADPVALPWPALLAQGQVVAEADWVIWFLANPRNDFPIVTTHAERQAGVRVLGALGDAEHSTEEPSYGGRFSVGYWTVKDNPWVPGGIRDLGVEAGFFFVGQRSSEFMENKFSQIVRPFFDVNNREPSGFLVAAPGLGSGGVVARSQVEMWGAEANLWKNVHFDYPGTHFLLNVMCGFRYLNANYDIDIDSITRYNPTVPNFPEFAGLAGNRLQVSDSFATRNHFYGPQVGVNGKWWVLDKMSIEAGAKLAVGVTHETLEIAGSQVRTRPDGTRIPSAGGLLALPSNSGTFQVNKFAQVPEVNVKVATPVTDWLTLSTGFSALYWTRVMRPGDQVQRDLDITQIPNFPPGAGATPTGLAQPGVPFKQSDLWLLGIQFGLEITW